MTDKKIELTEAELQAKIDEANEAVDRKNKDLLAEVKRLKAGKTIDPAEIERLESERDELRAKLAASEKANKTLQKTHDDTKKLLDSESGFTASLLIDQGLTAELTANGVTNPALLKGATALLKAQGVAVSIDGDKRVAKLGDKTLADAVKAFVATDEGKHFVAARVNSGGGAGGGTSAADGSKTMTRAQWEAADHGDRTKFAKEGGKVTD